MDGKAEALKTFIEQTKLLVTLASGFIVAPAVAVSILKGPGKLQNIHVRLFLPAEACLIASVIVGYIVLGTIAGSQDAGNFNVHRPATRIFSLLQLSLYLSGLICFVLLIRQ